VLQPTYSADGREVWLTVWNPQDQASAIVVVDDVTLEPTAVIRDPGLITPTRLYNLAALVPTPQRPANPGADLFASQCAHCHGRLGEGDGVMARELSARPQDLRYLSARNDGVFPREFVEEIVDGRATRASHGPADMPVWGVLLDASSVSALVDFVQQMQVER
jgi:mono/diheme cytochrome c family protein